MNTVLEEILRTGQVEDATGRRLKATSAVTREAGELLFDLVRTLRPQRTLEVGMAYGVSTMFICEALRENGAGSHTAIDPLQTQRFRSVGLQNLERAGFRDLVRFYEEPSHAVLSRLSAAGEAFDLIFVDGSHKFDFALVDVFFSDLMLPIGGHLVIDDLWMPAVRKVASFVLRNRPYTLVRPASRTPLTTRAMRVGRRVLQNPLGHDWPLKLVPENVAIFRKVAPDKRNWRFHRRF